MLTHFYCDTAPTNDAFAALPAGTVESLLLPENLEQLQDILKYHVVAANAHSSGLASGDVDTLLGDHVEITVSDSGVMVNDANVVTPDVIASNGIIHVIDKVLLPPDDHEGHEHDDGHEHDNEGKDPVDAAETTAAPTKMPTSMPTMASGSFLIGTSVAAIAIAAGVMASI